MVKEILHGYMNSYLYVYSIAKMLVARPDNDAIGNEVTKHIISCLKNLLIFHFL